MTKTKAGLERIASFARPKVSTSWNSPRIGRAISYAFYLGVLLTVVGSIARWGSLIVGVTIIALCVVVAYLDGLAKPQESPQQDTEGGEDGDQR